MCSSDLADDFVTGMDIGEQRRQLQRVGAGRRQKRLFRSGLRFKPGGAAFRERAVAGNLSLRDRLLDFIHFRADKRRDVKRNSNFQFFLFNQPLR